MWWFKKKQVLEQRSREIENISNEIRRLVCQEQEDIGRRQARKEQALDELVRRYRIHEGAAE